MKVNFIRYFCFLSAMCMLFTGCTPKTALERSKEVVITVGAWPKENNEHELKIYEGWKETFEKLNPNVKVVAEPYTYDQRTFMAKASSGQLPTYYSVPYTEPGKVAKSGYAADITKIAKEFGYDKEINKNALDICTVDQKIYGLPRSMYVLGLWCNVNVFKEAGLLDGDGVPIFPKTFDEVRATAKKIKDRTGKDGFLLPAKDNSAGWHFTNIAWNYGTEFEKEEGGKWVATFNTVHTKQVLKLIQDMRHIDNSLNENVFLGYADILKNFALDQVGMVIGAAEAPMINMMINQYGMDINNFSVCSMPSGPVGNVGLMGGDVIMFSPDATEDQIRAGIEFLKTCGYSPELDDIALKGMEDQFMADIANKNAVLPEPVNVWNNEQRMIKEKEIRAKYTNVKKELYDGYFQNATTNIRPEPPYNSQDLYKIFSSIIQTVMNNKDENIDELLKNAQDLFQKNYFDKMQ